MWVIESRFSPVSDAYARMIHPAEGCGKDLDYWFQESILNPPPLVPAMERAIDRYRSLVKASQ